MAKLTVFLEGTQITECELDSGKEYLLGRQSTCDIILDHPKVSRQHVKLAFDGQTWQCKVLSKFGNVLVNGHTMESFGLTNGVRFTISPFEILFEQVAQQDQIVEVQSSGMARTAPAGFNDDKTQTGAIQLKVVLQRLDAEGNSSEEILLGNEKIVAGRSQSCDLKLMAPEASRRHFSIDFDGRNYVITDLKSANKTYVNEKEITKQILQGGDVITVGSDQFRFEMQHPEFENLPAVREDSQVAVQDFDPAQQGQVPPPQYPAPYEGGPAAIKIMPQGGAPGPYYPPQQPMRGRGPADQKKALKVALLGIILVVIYQLATSKKDDSGREPANDAPPMTGSNTSGSTQGKSIDKLSADQKKFVEETYNLAMTLYMSGKAEQAGIEIEKIFKLVDDYKQARELQDKCRQAVAIKAEQDKIKRDEEEKAELQRKVSETLDNCENLIKEKKYSDVEGCVDQIANLDPDNARGQELVLKAKEEQAKIEASNEYREEQSRKKSLARSTLQRAENHFRERNYLSALKEFETVRKLAFVDSEGLKPRAETGVKSAKAALMKESQALISEGKSSMDQKDYAAALAKFSKALAIYPSNGDAQIYRDQAGKELHKEMKNLYDESVIEESLGNVESAKKKWAQIIQKDLKNDEYYNKATIKLRKYER